MEKVESGDDSLGIGTKPVVDSRSMKRSACRFALNRIRQRTKPTPHYSAALSPFHHPNDLRDFSREGAKPEVGPSLLMIW